MNQVGQTILLVEDSEDDVFTMRRALKKGGITNPVQVVTDGQQALDYLSGVGEYGLRAQYPLPFLILLDLKLPYLDGFEILSWLREQPALACIPVVILTGSSESRDRERACALGARSYLVKPPTPEMLHAVFGSLNSWLSSTDGTPVLSGFPNQTNPANREA